MSMDKKGSSELTTEVEQDENEEGPSEKRSEVDDFDNSLRIRILRWRFAGNLWWSIIGFWIKSVIEFGIMIGIPVGVFIIAATSVVQLSFSEIPLVPDTGHPELIAWFVITGTGWIQLRCLLADGIPPEAIISKGSVEQDSP